MQQEDLERVVEVWERARWDAQPWLEGRMGYDHASSLWFFREVVLPECEVWVATLGGWIVGLLAIRDAFVDRLYVEPSEQRCGVGTALLDRARERMPGGFRLYTHQRNTGARAFYEREGLHAIAFGVSPPPECEPDVEYAWEPEDVGRRRR
jgi:GNAT superfamily N-acetyltransferase